MGHNAAVDLAAAVRWKPCNGNLSFFFSSSSVWTLTRSFMSQGHFVTLRHLKPGRPPCDFRNTWLSMRKWALQSSLRRGLFCFSYTATFCRGRVCIIPTKATHIVGKQEAPTHALLVTEHAYLMAFTSECIVCADAPVGPAALTCPE